MRLTAMHRFVFCFVVVGTVTSRHSVVALPALVRRPPPDGATTTTPLAADTSGGAVRPWAEIERRNRKLADRRR